MEQELVEYIAKSLVDHPEQVMVNKRETSSSTILELTVAKDDMGRVIGKNGQVANAIRALLRVVATRQKTRIILEID
jgi:predicted RNA-binding protein YlqC (UPF0109 family)